MSSLIMPEKFQHIHRVMNTNIDGNRKVPFALTAIKVIYFSVKHEFLRIILFFIFFSNENNLLNSKIYISIDRA